MTGAFGEDAPAQIVEPAERSGDGLCEKPSGPRCISAHAFPEEAVIPGLRGVVEECRVPLPLRETDDLLERAGNQSFVQEKPIQRFDIAGIMLAVMDFQSLLRKQRLERPLVIRQWRERKG
jgi:hypothetical protein